MKGKSPYGPRITKGGGSQQQTIKFHMTTLAPSKTKTGKK